MKKNEKRCTNFSLFTKLSFFIVQMVIYTNKEQKRAHLKSNKKLIQIYDF